MSKTRVWIALCCCVLARGSLCPGAIRQKARPLRSHQPDEHGRRRRSADAANAAGRAIAAGDASLALRAAHDAGVRDPGHDRQVRWPSPAPQHGQCQVTDISKKANGMTAKMTCTGQMNTTGTIETTWTNANTSQTKMHMTGTMQMGSELTAHRHDSAIDVGLQGRRLRQRKTAADACEQLRN